MPCHETMMCECVYREDDMESIKFEILRDAEKKPTVTICTIRSNGDIGRGVAIRSLKDNPVKKIGRETAYGRAKKALYRKETTMPVYRKEAIFSIAEVHSAGHRIGLFHKSIYSEAQ